MNRMRLITAFALASCAACSSTSLAPRLAPPPPVSPSSPLSTQSNASGTLSIVIPPKSKDSNKSNHRGRAYVSPSAQELVLSVVNATTGVPAGNQTYALSATSPGCSPTANGSISCTLPFTAAPGSDTFTATLLDGNSVYAAVLAYGTLTKTIAAQASNAIALTLGGEINTFDATVSQTLVAGSAGSAPIDPAPSDYDGNPIVGTFDAPVTVSLTGDTADFTLSKTTLTQYPDPTFSLVYNGKPKATGVTIVFAVTSPIVGYQPVSSSVPFTVGYITQQNAGDSLTYSRTISVTSSGPDPVSTSPSVATIQRTISSGATFNGMSNLLDVRSVVTTSGSTSTTTEDQYENYTTSGSSTALNEYGYNVVSGTQTQQVQYAVPLVTDVLPENAATQLNYDVGYSYTLNDTNPAGPQQYKEQLNADGSYTLQDMLQFPSDSYSLSETITENPNGTATDTLDQTGANEQVTTYGLPVASNGAYTIPVTTSGGNDSSQPPTSASTVNVPDWIPGNAGFPQLFTYPAYVVSTTIGPACGPWSGLVANDVASTVQAVDPLGAVENDRQDKFEIPSVGVVCILDYYDDSTYDATSTGKLLSETITSGATILSSEMLQNMLRHPRTARRVDLSDAHDAVAAVHAHAIALRLRMIRAAHARHRTGSR